MSIYAEKSLQLNATSSTYGTIFKKIIAELCALCPDIRIVNATTDTAKAYGAYLGVLGDDGIVVKLSNDTSSISASTYYSKAGTYTYIVNWSSLSSALPTGTVTYKIQVVYLPDVCVFARIYFSNSKCVNIYGYKAKDLCSEEVRTFTGCSVSTSTDIVETYCLVDDVYYAATQNPMINSASNNNYTRMHPMYLSANGFVGTPIDKTALYYGYTNGSTMSLTRFAEFSVANVRFMSLGGNFAIRMD